MAVTGADFRSADGDGLMGHEINRRGPFYVRLSNAGDWVCRGHADDFRIQGATTVAT